MGQPADQFNRPLRDLRISVTDRCNFRCPYCMPADVFGPGHAFLREPQLMSAAEFASIVRAFRALGVEKVRLTGGEPLLRSDTPELVRRLKQELGLPDVALTTNGWLLEKLAPALRAAGLDRLNVSVDSIDDATAGKLNGLGFKVARVLRGIDAATALGMPVKINCVVQRGVNDHELLDLCDYFRQRGHTLRFIEFMDVGNTNHWQRERVVPAREIVDRISRAVGTDRPGVSWRGRGSLSVPRRPRRDRTDQLGNGAVLSRLPSRALVRRRQALHVLVRIARLGRAGGGAGGIERSRARSVSLANLARPRRSLQRRALDAARDRRASGQDRDELHRRIARDSVAFLAW